MKQLIAFSALAAAMAPAALAGEKLKPRDLTPVTWMDAPAHPPVEIVREGRARATVFLADSDPSETLERLVDELVETIRLSSGATLERVTESPAVSRRKRGGRDGIVARAFENAIYYVFANSAGPQGNGEWSAGDSKIVGPDEKVLALADNRSEAMIMANQKGGLAADEVLNPTGYGQESGGTPLDFIVPDGDDGFTGMFVRRAAEGKGPLTARGVTAVWDFAANKGITKDLKGVSIRPFGIEMVYVAEGPFYLGSGGRELVLAAGSAGR